MWLLFKRLCEGHGKYLGMRPLHPSLKLSTNLYENIQYRYFFFFHGSAESQVCRKETKIRLLCFHLGQNWERADKLKNLFL